jgi:hypothetical protein
MPKLEVHDKQSAWAEIKRRRRVRVDSAWPPGRRRYLVAGPTNISPGSPSRPAAIMIPWAMDLGLPQEHYDLKTKY